METSIRHVVLLSLLPREPARTDVKSLMFEVAARGYPVSRRTIERDLHGLSAVFPITCTENAKPAGWAWDKNAPPLGASAMHPVMALAVLLATAAGLLPSILAATLQPLAAAARNMLDNPRGRPVGGFSRRFRVRPGAGVAPGRVESPVAEAVVRALSEGRRLSARYRGEGKRGGAFVLEPLGLVAEGGALTLVARAARSPEPRRFALSGFTSARVLDEAADDRGFDLDAFLETADAVADVAVRVRGEALAALAGSPLADGQTVEPLGEDEGRVRARVPQGPALLGRLLALGGDAVVEAPAALAAQVASTARAVAARYSQRERRTSRSSRGRAGARATSKPQ